MKISLGELTMEDQCQCRLLEIQDVLPDYRVHTTHSSTGSFLQALFAAAHNIDDGTISFQGLRNHETDTCTMP